MTLTEDPDGANKNAQPLLAGLELGGTKCIAVLARGASIVARSQVPTGNDAAATLGSLSDRLSNWQDEHGLLDAIGIASFGPLGLDPSRADFGFITRTAKPGWSGVDVRGQFATRFACPIGFDTDVAGAALAEGRWGAAQGCRCHIYLTIGTGIGGGLIVDGRAVHGRVHPEMGHIRVRRDAADSFAGTCPFHGDCLEGLASGTAIAARVGRPAEQLAPDDLLWRQIAAEIAELMAMLILTVSPEKILVGGGVGQGCTSLLPMIRDATSELLGGYIANLERCSLDAIIVPPTLGDDAGPLGSIALALDALRASVANTAGPAIKPLAKPKS